MNLEFKGKIDKLISEVAAIPDLVTKIAVLNYIQQESGFLLWQLEDEQRIDEDFREIGERWLTRSLRVIVAFALIGCAGGYSFTGASIPPGAKTLSVATFPNNASTVNPQLSQKLTDELMQMFSSQTPLTVMNGEEGGPPVKIGTSIGDIIAGMNYLRNNKKSPEWGTDPVAAKPEAVPQEKKSGKKNKRKR